MKRIVITLFVCFAATFSMQAQSTKVLIKTTMGDIVLMLYDDTPIHRDNFIELVNNKFYDGILYHRVMQNFMIQVGQPQSRDKSEPSAYKGKDPNYQIPAEIRPNHYHKKGALAAARQPDEYNPKKESSGTQFYIVQGKTWTKEQLDAMESRRPQKYTAEERKHYSEVGGYPSLDFEYTVFGEVVSNLDVVDAIAAVECEKPSNRPVKPVKIISARVIK